MAGREPALLSLSSLPSGFVPDLLYRERRATLLLTRKNGKTRAPVLVEESGCRVSGATAEGPFATVIDGPGGATLERLTGLMGWDEGEAGPDPTGPLAERALAWAGPGLQEMEHPEPAVPDPGARIMEIRHDAKISMGAVLVARRDGQTGGKGEAARSVLEVRASVTVGRDGRAVTADATRWADPLVDPSAGSLAPWQGVAREALASALELLDAVTPPAMEAPVIFSPRAAGFLLHEICGHLLEGDLVAAGTSPFARLAGDRIAAPGVTILDDPFLPGGRVQLPVDDEGELSSRRTLIEEGRLIGFLTHRQSARITGGASTGNARRESYKHPALPRMTNLVMSPGDADPADLPRGISRGLLVDRLGRGQVDPRLGQFRLEVESGRLIESGRPSRPVAGAFLVGSCRDLMKAIDAVGSDFQVDPGAGTCVKDDQAVPVGQGSPSLRVSRMKIIPGAVP